MRSKGLLAGILLLSVVGFTILLNPVIGSSSPAPAAKIAFEKSDCTPFISVLTNVDSSFTLASEMDIAFEWTATCAPKAVSSSWQVVRVLDHVKPYLDDETNRVPITEVQEMSDSESGDGIWSVDPNSAHPGILAIMIRLYDDDGKIVAVGGRSFVGNEPLLAHE